MNNACPSCGAVYAVTAKDIGRKLKCKKCQSALIVADSGLEIDGPGGPPPSLPAHEESFASAVADDGEGDDSEEVVTKKSKKGKKDKPPRQPTDYKALAAQATAFSSKFGGISTLLFGFGVFLVIWFVFQSKIGEASAMSDAMYVHKLELEKKSRIEAAGVVKAKDKAPSTEEFQKAGEAQAKISEEYDKKIKDANEDAGYSRIRNKRSVYWDRWGTMIGFFFLSFGCIGYLRTEQHMVVKIVAGAILTLMMLVVFAGVSCDKASDLGPDMPIGKG
jgi:predicted Zn finger-like uncharacterized protein